MGQFEEYAVIGTQLAKRKNEERKKIKGVISDYLIDA
jgi:hypothetical protein